MKEKTPQRPSWDPSKGNIFEWVLALAERERAKQQPADPTPFQYRLRKV